MENNNWQQIPDQREGNVRCIETGIEICAIGNGFRWEVLRPEWRRGERKIMHTERIFTTKIAALDHATRATRPVMRERIAYDHAEALLTDHQLEIHRRNPFHMPPMPTPAERIAASPPATDAELAQASRYALGLRARILKRLQVAEEKVATLQDDLAEALAEIDRLRGDA